MRGWREGDYNSYTGRPWRSRVRVRKEGGGGGGWEGGVVARCRQAGSQSRIIPRYIKESSPRKYDG